MPPLLDVIVQLSGVAVLAQFGERFGLYLADAFAGHGEFLTYFFQRMRFTIFQAEPQLEDLLFAFGERRPSGCPSPAP